MESFFEFIFANLFLVIIIIAVIINFLNRGRREEQKKQQQQQQQQRRRPSIPEMRETRTYEQASETIQETKQKLENTAPTIEKSIEEQQQEQYDRLRSQYQVSSQTEAEDNEKTVDSGMNNVPPPRRDRSDEEHVEVNVDLNKKLTSEGLIESVIMAEVLGSPRALSPYQNIISKRKQR